MQEDSVRGEIVEILRRLEDLRGQVGSRALERAIMELRIALNDLDRGIRRSSEGLDHYSVKLRLIEKFTEDGGSCYIESEQTKISKIGYRPDAIIIKDDELIIVEVETDQRRMIEKLRKIRRKWNEITSTPLLTGRRLRIVFGVTDNELRDDVLREARRLVGVEIYSVSDGGIVRLF